MPVLCGSEPWSAPFAKDTARILQAANAVPAAADETVVVLLDTQQFHIDAQRRTTVVQRKVCRVVAAGAVEAWSSLEHECAPWYENRPELRARVMTADG